MAKPRIFLSSTYYDLRQVRADLERFIKELGYEPVLNEQGNIPYGKDDLLEDYCYKEISNVDILVSLIGGRYGSESKHEKHSVSQLELKTAYDQNKQVYIFIDKSVYNEYRFYLNNKDNNGVKYTYADNVKIHEFIEFVESLPNNNTIHGFETSNDITTFLKEQWSGLFQRFLQEQTRQKEISIIKGIETTSKTLNQLVTFLTEEKRDKDKAINDILLSNHPAMEQIKEILGIPYRVFFTNREEFTDLIKARGFNIDADYSSLFEEDERWVAERNKKRYELTFRSNIFNGEDKLRVFTKDEWDLSNMSIKVEDIEDDGLPF
ncbi:MAG: DUF4062 domain-containing protein [Nitrososphaeraceae archaeon]